jgi:hypothetical protein
MSRFVVGATWDDAPHLTKEAKDSLWNSIPPYQRDARAKGVPQLGAGAIYPIPEAEIKVKPFEIPKYWPRAFGMDVGWNKTAGLWGALDPQSGVTYFYSEYYKGEAEPVVHAQGWRDRGLWIPGRIDPAARGRSQVDGKRLIELYRKQKLLLDTAMNAVETGLLEMWTALSTGRVKVFETLSYFFAEYRLYQRDEKGRVKKQKDHLMDCMRYVRGDGTSWWVTKPIGWQDDGTIEAQEPTRLAYDEGSKGLGWMAG